MLRRKLADELLPTRTPGRLAVTFQSFGFKYGPARDPDLLLDVRFLPNPHYEPDLRPLTGDDPRIVEFINRGGELDAFYDKLHPLLDYLLPQYLAEGKAHLVVAIGCTGGRHRSVAIAVASGEPLRPRSPSTSSTSFTETSAADVIDHIGFEVSDLDAVEPVLRRRAVRARGQADGQSEHVVAYGVNGPQLWIVVRGRPPRAGLRPRGAAGERQGGGRCRLRGRARQRWQRRRRARACVRSTAGATTRRTCAIPTGCGWKSSRADELASLRAWPTDPR